MKKNLFIVCILSVFLLAGCMNNSKNNSSETNSQNNIDTKQQDNSQESDIAETLKTIIHDHESCSDSSTMFIDIAILGNSTNENGNTEYYLVVDGQGFEIDERGNLTNSCGFGEMPTTIELAQDKKGYNLINYQTAKDGTEYDSSAKEMFSEDAYNTRKTTNYSFVNENSLLEEAEEHFGIKIIPENKNKFECTFCDKLRYYNAYDNDEINTNGLIFNYTTQDNGKNTIYFGSDGIFEAKGSRDEGTGTWTFGEDKNTVIVLNNNSDHVYDRYIITKQDENSLNTILEIIQRR